MEIARRARGEAIEQGDVDMAFFEYQLGEFARLAGDATTARNGFDAALFIRPGISGPSSAWLGSTPPAAIRRGYLPA